MFDSLPLHPAVVHLPIGILFVLPMVTLFVLTLYFRKFVAKPALLVIVLLQGLLVGTSYLAIETGENEEHRVERIIKESLIETHEERAETFMAGTVVVFIISLGLIIHFIGLPAGPIMVLILAGQLVLLVLGYRVGHSGGELVYVHGAAQAYTEKNGSAFDSSTPLKSYPKEDEHDDD